MKKQYSGVKESMQLNQNFKMSTKSHSQSPITSRWKTKPEDDKENIQHKLKQSELRKKFDGLSQKPLTNKNDIDAKTSKKVVSTGAKPKYFDEVNNVPREKNILRRQGATLELSSKRQPYGPVYTKAKFEVFEEEFEPGCNSTTVQEYREAVFKKAKTFFEQGAQGTSGGETKKLKRLKTIDESNSPLKHQRVKVTPHVVPAPQPEKVKVLHKLASIEQESTRKSHRRENDKETDFPYLQDIFLNEQKKDQRGKFNVNYRQMNASADQRQKVGAFIIRVCYHNALPSYIVYQTVRIFDDMLQAKRIPFKDLQLVMITALWIVWKMETADNGINATKMAELTNGLCKKEDIVKCEVEIMMTLNFEVVYPEPVSLLCVCMWSVKNADSIDQEKLNEMYYCGCYMIDLATLDEDLITKSTVLLAVTAAELAMTIVAEQEDTLHCARFDRWRSQQGWLLVENDDIFVVKTLLIRNIIESCQKSSRSHIVYKKYCRSRYGKVADMLIEKSQMLQASIALGSN